jgi:hypothetical protein
MTKENAIEVGHNVMNNIGFDWWDREDKDGVTAVFISKEKDGMYKDDWWLVSFPYGKEDYGENVHYMISIINSTEVAKDISFRNDFVKLGIDANGKYFIAERRP